MKTNLLHRLSWTAFSILALLFMLASCSAPKNIAYFQDAELIRGMMLNAEQQFKLRPEDKINIIVNSSNPMLEQQFSLTANSNMNNTLGATTSPRTTAGKSSGSLGMTIAYTVDDQGTINFPVLGRISVLGKTRTEVADYIQKRLIARELVDDPIVTVEYVNMGVNILGEVAHPGHIDITRDHLTIVDAISYAGDLTISGQRERVLVFRNEEGVDQTYVIDLTNRQQMLLSPAYYLQQNDVVYVAPNKKKMRDAQATGNTFNTPGFWMSLTSLAMTLITFLTTVSK